MGGVRSSEAQRSEWGAWELNTERGFKRVVLNRIAKLHRGGKGFVWEMPYRRECRPPGKEYHRPPKPNRFSVPYYALPVAGTPVQVPLPANH